VPLDRTLLEILVCPKCRKPLTLVKNDTAFKCGECHRVYAIVDDVPNMLIDDATIEP
jgi:LSD1 subclass zinc finger protein